MTPSAKFNSIIVTTTTFIMYLLWICIENIDDKYIEKYRILLMLITALSSLGFYRLLITSLRVLFEKIKFIKKFILGNRYLEGTWIGFYIGNGQQIRYIYETYEQTLENVLISGYSFKEDKSTHGIWKASNPLIDCTSKEVIYYYETNMLANLYKNQGFASFILEKNEKQKYFDKMQGFSSDLHSPNKIYAIEEKVSDEFWTDKDKILKKAEEIYNKNKEFLPK